MLAFPQLSTGCIAQAPFVRQEVGRRVTRPRLDGVLAASLRDTNANSIRWDLSFTSLSDEERERIEALFIAAQGSLRSFTFLDPADNLLRWSEDFSNSVWLKDSGLAITPGVQDAFGGLAAATLANSTAAVRALSQTIAAPASFTYCLSLYLRAGAPSNVGVRLAAVGVSESFEVSTSQEWRRVNVTGALTSIEESLTVSVAVGANATLDVCGAQLEAQGAPSGYRRTLARSGVYPNTRFRDDRLTLRAEGVNEHSTGLRLISRL